VAMEMQLICGEKIYQTAILITSW